MEFLIELQIMGYEADDIEFVYFKHGLAEVADKWTILSYPRNVFEKVLKPFSGDISNHLHIEN